MPLIERIDGRDSEMFYVETADGTRAISPLMFEFAVSQILDAREYQIIHEETNRFRILIEPLSRTNFNLEDARSLLREHLITCGMAAVLHADIEVVDRLDSDGNSKFKRVVDTVGEFVVST